MEQKSFTILFKRAPDYKIYPGQIIYGGPVPDGSGILMNFCVDHSAFPNYVQYPITEDGKVDTNTIEQQVQMGNVERELLSGVYLTVDQAQRLADWLYDNIRKIRER
jgi:hypothetical protein